MGMFDFSEVGNAQSTSRKSLEGNAIHRVTFDGIEMKDVEGKQAHNAGTIYKMLEIKFSNEEGTFTHGVFEVTADDMKDRESQYGPQPGNGIVTMKTFRHLIDAINPKLGEEIDAKTKTLGAATWDGLRKLLVEITTPSIGVTTNIKLIKNKKGQAIFPYAFAYNKDKVLYMKGNFIGEKVFFSDKEQTQIKKEATAKPTPAGGVLNLDMSSSPSVDMPMDDVAFDL